MVHANEAAAQRREPDVHEYNRRLAALDVAAVRNAQQPAATQTVQPTAAKTMPKKKRKKPKRRP